MFGFDLQSFKEKLDVVNTTLSESTFDFTVDDVHVIVSPRRIVSLTWQVEPTPDELMAAINQSFELLEGQIAEERETAIQNLLEGVKEPVKSMIKSQFSTLLN